MSFFKDIFRSESPVSSRRLIALWVAFVILSIIVWKGLTPDNAVDFLVPVLIFLGSLLGITTTQNIMSLIHKNSAKKSVGGDNEIGGKDDEQNNA